MSERINPYRELNLAQAEALHEALQERYWNLMDALGSIAVDKGLVADRITTLQQGGGNG
jgi:hypothetical protein